MSEAYTKLGIEIEVGKKVTVDTTGVTAAATKITQALKSAVGNQDVFANISNSLTQLTKILEGINFSKITQGIKGAKDAVNDLDIQSLVQKIKELDKTNADMAKQLEEAVSGRLKFPAKAVAQAAQYLGASKDELKKQLTQYAQSADAQKIVLEEFKGYRGDYNNPGAKVVELQRKEQAEQGKQLLAALKNTRTAAKEEQDKIVENWKQYLAALKNSGQQLYNGEVIPKSRVTDIGKAWDAAHAEAARRSKQLLATTQVIDPVKAESLARTQQAFNIIEQLKRTLQSTAVVAKDAAEAFKQGGVNLKDLDDKSANKVAAALKHMNIAADTTTNSFKDIQKEVKQTSAWTKIFGESLGKMAGRLTEFYSLRTAIFAVGSQIREATSAAINMNQAVHDILAISGDSKETFGAVSSEIYSIARNSRYSAEEVAGLTQVLAQAGVKAEDLGKVSKQVSLFATGAGADPKVAADLVTTAMNVFELKANDTARVTNALTAALNLSKLEAAGLSTAFNYLAPQAAQLGMSMEQSLGIISNMAQAGIKASTIGTGVSQMLKEFAAPKARLKSMLGAYHINPEEINPMTHEFADIVERLQRAKVTVDDLFQAMDTRVGRAVVASVNLTGASFREMTNNITGTHAAVLAYDKSMEGARARMNVVTQDVNLLAAEIGQSLAPAFIVGLDVIRTMIEVLSSGDGKIAAVTLGLGALTVSVITLNAAVKGLISVGLLSSALTSWGTLLPAISAGFTVVAKAVASVALGVVPMTSLATGGLKAIGVALAGLFTPVTALTALIVALTVGLGALIYRLGETRREYEEKQKVVLKEIEANEQLGRSYESITRSHEGLQTAQKEYIAIKEKVNKQIKDGLITQEQGNKILAQALKDKRQDITLTDEETKGLYKNIGAGKTLLDGLLGQGKVFEALLVVKEQNIETNNRLVRSETAVYNRLIKQAQLEATKSWFGASATKNGIITRNAKGEEEVDYAKRQSAFGTQNSEQAFNAQFQTRKAIKGILGFGGVAVKDLKQPATIDGNVIHNIATGERTIMRQDPRSLLYAEQTLPAPKGKPEPGDWDGGKHSHAGAAVKADNYLITIEREVAKGEADAAKQLMETYRKTLKDTEIAYSDREKAYDLASEELQKEFSRNINANNVRLGAQFAAANKGAKYDSDTDTLSGVNKEGVAYKKYLQAKTAQTRAFMNEYAKQEEALQAEFNSVEKKSLEKFNQLSQKSIEEELKVREELEKKRFDFAMAVGTAEIRITAYADYIASTEAKVLEKYKEQREKLWKEFSSWSPEAQNKNSDKYLKAIAAIDAAQKEELEKNKTAVNTAATDKIDSNIVKGEKQISSSLANKQAELTLQKEQAWTGDQINAVEAKNQQLILESLQAKSSLYEKEQASLESLILQRIQSGEVVGEQDKQVMKAKDLKDQLDGINNAIGLQKIKVKESADESFTGNFTQGVQQASQQMGSFKSMTVDLGASVATTFTEGITNSLYNMVDALGKGKDAWAAFKDGVGNMLKDIGAMLMKYVLQMLVVYAVQQLIGFAVGAGSGAASTGMGTNGIPMSTTNLAQSGGLITLAGIQKFNNGGSVDGLLGGMVPLNMGQLGKDSVPAILEPGEVIIKKSTVDYYGADRLLALNQGKIAKFAEGGAVGATKAKNSSNNNDKSNGTPYSFSIINVADVNSIPPIDGQAVVNIVSFDAAKKGPTYHTIRGVMQG